MDIVEDHANIRLNDVPASFEEVPNKAIWARCFVGWHLFNCSVDFLLARWISCSVEGVRIMDTINLIVVD